MTADRARDRKPFTRTVGSRYLPVMATGVLLLVAIGIGRRSTTTS